MKPYLRLLLAGAALGAVGLLCSSCSPQAKKARHLAEADKSFAAGQYDKAEIEYRNVLQIDPVNPVAIAQLGIIYFDQGRVSRVLPFLMKGRELQPENLDLRLKLGQVEISAGKMKEARDEAAFVLKRKPQDEEAPLLLAEASVRSEEIEAARQLLAGLPPPAADGAPVQVARGLLELRQGRLAEAEAALQRAQTANPNSSAAQAALGVLYQNRQNPAAAEQAFKRASELAPPRSARRLLYARFKLQTGDAESGRRALEEVSQKTPDYLPALVLLSEIAAAEKKYPAAAALVAKVLAMDPAHPDALLLSARLKLAQGDKAAAVTEMEKMTKIYGQSPQVHYQLGLAYYANGDLPKAAASLSQAVALAPGMPEPTLLLAEINLRKGDARSAILALKPLVQQRPELVQARFLLADADRMSGDLNEALSIYRQLEEMQPRNPQPTFWRGTVLLQQGQRKEAGAAFEKALAIAPDYILALDQLVALDLGAKDVPAARRRVEEKIAQFPKLPGLYLLQARIALVQKNETQAEAALQTAIQLQPEAPAAYLLLARLYANSNQLEKALANSQAVLAKQPNNVEALMMAGSIQNQKGDWPGTRATYEKLLAVNPRFIPALNNLAYLYSEQFNELDKAQAMAQKALELLPHEPHTTDTLGWILYKRRQYPWAVSQLLESAAKLPDDPEVQFHLGMTHYMMGNDAAARSALERALQLDANFSGKADAQARLDVLAVDVRSTGARGLLEKAVAAHPDDPVASTRLSALYAQAGEPDKALATIQAAVTANPTNVAATMELIRALAAKGDLAKALELGQNAHKLAPEDAQVTYTLGRLAWQKADYPWALSLLQESARRLADDPELLYDLAAAHFSMGRISDAQDTMRRALDLGGRFSHQDEGRQFLEMIALATNPSQPPTAESTLDRILQAKPDYVPALFARATVNERQAKAGLAQAGYEKVLSLYPDFAPAKKRLAVMFAENPGANSQKIFDMALKAREALPDDPELAKALGILLYTRSDYARAAGLLNESARKTPADPALMFYLGMTQFRLKQMVESKASLQQALTLGLRPDLATVAQKTLGEIK